MKNRSKVMWISNLWLAATLLSFATSAFAAANTSGLISLSLQGVGTGALSAGACTQPSIPCPPGHTCRCLTGAQTIVGNRFNGGSLTFELSVDTTDAALPISTTSSCFAAGGFAMIANTTGKNTLSIDITGLSCPTVGTDGGPAPAQTFNGTYVVRGGTNFNGGTGAVSASFVGTATRSSLNGNLQ